MSLHRTSLLVKASTALCLSMTISESTCAYPMVSPTPARSASLSLGGFRSCMTEDRLATSSLCSYVCVVRQQGIAG